MESKSQFPSSDSIIMEWARDSFSFVNSDAALPYSSILPVDSGVSMPMKRAFSTPEGIMLSGTKKCTVSPSTNDFTVTSCFAVSAPEGFTDAA